MQVINGIPLVPGEDDITSTEKVTSGYHTGGSATLSPSEWTTGSLSDSVETYYYDITKESTTGTIQWQVAYGNINGKGGNTDSDAIKSPTEAIYREWSNILLPEFEVTGGFFISANKSQSPSDSTIAAGTKDTDFYILIGQRSLFKDRLNKKNWTLTLTGSNSAGASGTAATGLNTLISLTDDSEDVPPVYTPAGPRYNIVSGSDGSVVSASSARTFGFFYPDQGVMIFSAAELSRSIPGNGTGTHIDDAVVFGSQSHAGFVSPTVETKDTNTALRFINCMSGSTAAFKFRSEEDQTSVSYFCRAKATQMNYSNNPTFVSGSDNLIRQKTLRGNPTVYITGVELYDGIGNIVATGKLSSPLKKNFSSEATIKAKITF